MSRDGFSKRGCPPIRHVPDGDLTTLSSGDKDLALEIEAKGYDQFEKAAESLQSPR